MRIWLDPELLKARNLTTDEVLDALKEQNVQVAAGKIGEEPNAGNLNFEYTLTTLGRLSDVEPVRADHRQAWRSRDSWSGSRTWPGSSWVLSPTPGTPSSTGLRPSRWGSTSCRAPTRWEWPQGVIAAMEDLSERFPEGLEYSIPYDATRYIQASINEVVASLIIAIILVIFTVYIFLQDFRTTIVPSVTIPVSLIGTFAVMLVTGQSINNLTLFGLVLAIGIVVDDAIVVVENTMRIDGRRGARAQGGGRQGHGRGRRGDRRHHPGAAGGVRADAGHAGSDRPDVPAVRHHHLGGHGLLVDQRADPEPGAVRHAAAAELGGKKKGWFFTQFNKYFDRMSASYGRAVSGLIRKAAIAMIVFAGLVVAMVYGFGAMPGGFVPSEDEGYFFVNAQLPNAASLQRTREVMDTAMAEVQKVPGVQNIITIGGYSLLDRVQGPNYGAAIVSLVPWSERENTVFELIRGVSGGLAKIREGTAFAFGPPPIQGLGSGSGFQMELQDLGGVGLQQLETFANDMVTAGFESGKITRLNQNFQSNVPQIYIDVDREKTKRLNIPLQSIFDTLQTNLGSAYVNDFNLFGRTWRVMVQADEQFRSRVGDIQRLEVRTAEGRMVPLSTLISVHEDGRAHRSSIDSTCSRRRRSPVHRRPDSARVSRSTRSRRLPTKSSPAQMGFAWSGVTQQQKEAGNMAPLIFGLALIMVFLFLAAQYESWATPLSVLLSVPLAILGAIVFTLMRGFDNNIYTQIGFVLLIGMSAKNAILIVEFAKQQRDEEGKSIIEAAREAARLRFRPILMTALSFLLGVIPLVIATGAGANSRVSLGTAVFGGMLAATVFGVFMIPLLYVVVQQVAEKLGGKKSTPAPTPRPSAPPPVEPAT